MIDIEETSINNEFLWNVPMDLPYFDGHFPGRPILPAVAIVDANFFILKKTLGADTRLKKVISARFSSPILPGAKIKIKINKKTDTTWSFEWKQITNAKTIVKMDLNIESKTR